MPRNSNAVLGALTVVAAGANAAADNAALDQAFAALQTYNHGASRAVLLPLDDAIVAALDNASARHGLEQRLGTVLQTGAPAVAKEYVCRQLALIGSDASVPALARLLGDADLGHTARAALEAMPCPAAAEALGESLPRLAGLPKTGAINSLGRRHDARRVSILAALLQDADGEVARAAAAALGEAGTVAAAKALRKFQPRAPEPIRSAVADACLVCAERLRAAGKPSEAGALYQLLAGATEPKHIQAAARRGLSL